MNNNETPATTALDALLAKMVDAYAADVAAQIVARYRADEAVLSHNGDLGVRIASNYNPDFSVDGVRGRFAKQVAKGTRWVTVAMTDDPDEAAAYMVRR